MVGGTVRTMKQYINCFACTSQIEWSAAWKPKGIGRTINHHLDGLHVRFPFSFQLGLNAIVALIARTSLHHVQALRRVDKVTISTCQKNKTYFVIIKLK